MFDSFIIFLSFICFFLAFYFFVKLHVWFKTSEFICHCLSIIWFSSISFHSISISRQFGLARISNGFRVLSKYTHSFVLKPQTKQKSFACFAIYDRSKQHITNMLRATCSNLKHNRLKNVLENPIIKLRNTIENDFTCDFMHIHFVLLFFSRNSSFTIF